MLAKQGILTEEERDQILGGLDSILADVESGKLEITSEYEDIHSFVEANLIDRIGDPVNRLPWRRVTSPNYSWQVINSLSLFR